MESKWKAYNNLLNGSHQNLHINVFKIYCLSWNLLGVSAFIMAFNLVRGSTMCSEIHSLSSGEILFQSAKENINRLNSLIDVFLKNLIKVKICGCPINIWQLNTRSVQKQFKSQESERWQQQVITRLERSEDCHLILVGMCETVWSLFKMLNWLSINNYLEPCFTFYPNY